MIALVAHRVLRSYILASFGAAMIASVVFQCVIYLQLGYLDPFFMIALVVGGVVALVVAAIVGIPFLWVRRKKQHESTSKR